MIDETKTETKVETSELEQPNDLLGGGLPWDDAVPVFECFDKGWHYKIYADGTLEGFPGSTKIINRIRFFYYSRNRFDDIAPHAMRTSPDLGAAQGSAL